MPDDVVRAKVVPNTDASSLIPAIAQNVERGATVMTDSHSAYQSLSIRWVHGFIDHAQRYVDGQVHTNGIENFWSLLKRTIRGSYVHVSHWQLQRYIDEQVFRFNQRILNDAGRFRAVMQAVVGKRLTYRRLAMVDGEGFMGCEQ